MEPKPRSEPLLPTVGQALRRGVVLVLVLALYVVVSRILIVRLTWIGMGLCDLLVFAGWLVLVARAFGQVARALGLRRAIGATAVWLGAVTVLVPLAYALVVSQPLFFWAHRSLLEEAAEKAALGQFEVVTKGNRQFLRLPVPYDRLAQGREAWVIKDGERDFIVFPQSALAGEFNGYCRVLDGKPPMQSCTAEPVLGGGGVWFRVDRG